MRRFDRRLEWRVLLPLTVFCSPGAAAQTSECEACIGGADSDASTAIGVCPGAQVSISVTIDNADCDMVWEPPGFPICTPGDSCVAHVTRTWSGVNPDSEMDFCLKPPGQARMCRDTDPNTPGIQGPSSGPTGSGSESDFDNPFIQCGAGTYQFSINADCGGYEEQGEPISYVTARAFVACVDHCS